MQGVAEVLPVSSSAHLALLPALLGWPQPPSRTTYAAALHAGSCAGLLWALRDDLRALLGAPAGRRTLALALATSGPAAVAGLVAADRVEARLGSPRTTAGLLAAAGLGMALADRRPQTRGVDPRAAAAAALAQVVALAPGVSRSGAALTALRALEVRRADAARFALLMSLPVTAGAAGLTLLRAGAPVLRELAAPLATGLPAAAVAAAVTLRTRAGGPLLGPALYRLGLAAAVAVRERGSA